MPLDDSVKPHINIDPRPSLMKRVDMAPIVIFFLAFFIRLRFISIGPYHVDCLHLTLAAEKTLATGKLVNLFGTGYPLTVLLASTFIRIFRWFGAFDSVLAVNFMSVVMSSLSVWVLYHLVAKLFDRTAAVYSALFLTFFPHFLAISVYGKSHTPSLFFLLASLYFLVDFLGSYRRRDLLSSGICFGLMSATRLQDAMLVFPAVLFLLVVGLDRSPQNPQPWRSKLKRSILFSLTAFVIALLFHLPFLMDSHATKFLGQFDRFWTAGVSTNFKGLFSEANAYTLKNLFFGFGPLAFMSAVAGLGIIMKKSVRLAVFLSLWAAVPLLFYGSLMTSVTRFFVLPSLALIISLGVFFARFTHKNNVIFRSTIIGVFVLMLTLLFCHMWPVLQFRHTHALLPEFGRMVNDRTEPDALIICADEGLFIKHYGQRRLLSRPRAFDTFRKDELQSFRQGLKATLKNGVPVYITGSGLWSYDPNTEFSRMMEEHFTLEKIAEQYSEDWHHGGTLLRTGIESLWRVRLRE